MATPFQPTFDKKRIENMRELLKLTSLDELAPLEPPGDNTMRLGIRHDFLKKAKAALEAYDVKQLEKDIAKLNHFTTEIEDVKLHFIHHRSSRPNAVPLLILHGWPGTFYDFREIIEPLTSPKYPWIPAFHVVAPSLPGYAWSHLPRKKDFDLEDMARIFDKLMVETLGYKQYVGQGGDWGSHIMGWQATNHANNMPLVHFCSFPCSSEQRSSVASYTRWLNHVPLVPRWIMDHVSRTMREWGLGPEEKARLRRYVEFGESGGGYSAIQSTRPSTIGYALAPSPLSLLAYIGEKKLAWEDPSCFEMSDLLATTAIYFLTNSFATSVMIYQQSTKSVLKLIEPGRRGGIKSGVGYSVFPYDIESPPEHWVAQWGKMLQFRSHQKGGHFPAIEHPDAFVQDLRDLVSNHWEPFQAKKK